VALLDSDLGAACHSVSLLSPPLDRP
jgi:hypothetical protein